VTITECVLLFLLSANGAYIFSHMRRIQEVERKLNLVLTHLGIDPNAQVAPSSHVMNLAKDPRKRIEAIKAYREQTGAGQWCSKVLRFGASPKLWRGLEQILILAERQSVRAMNNLPHGSGNGPERAMAEGPEG
jgi:hypothetical protein